MANLQQKAVMPLQYHAHIEALLREHWCEGLVLCMRIRIVSLFLLIIVTLGFVQRPEAYYYVFLILCLLAFGYLQLKNAHSASRLPSVVLLFFDLILVVVAATVPNPLSNDNLPLAFTYNFDIYKYLFLFLATAILAHSWLIILAASIWAAGLWIVAAIIIASLSAPDVNTVNELSAVFPESDLLMIYANPYLIGWDLRIQEAVTLVLCGVILSFAVHRFKKILNKLIELERVHTNLARYFSPNMVDKLSRNDEPLKQVGTQDVAVLFVDIVGFTEFASERDSSDVIFTLREFYKLLSQEIFEHQGTLDKFLGDGLMATFGTPVSTSHDAANALRCTNAMIQRIDEWNSQRRSSGDNPLSVSFGLHYGPVVVGDIGVENRLEFAVIGNTVNIASRLESQSRILSCRVVASERIIRMAKEQGCADSEFSGLKMRDYQKLSGVPEPIVVWSD